MRDLRQLQQVLDAATVDADVFALRPDYRAVLVAAFGLEPAGSDEVSEQLLRAAEQTAAEVLAGNAVEQLPEVAAWRDAYRAFGAKPQRTRNSLEALLRRVPAGLPRVNRLTDLYNAVSVQHLLPLGGEDLDRYQGAAHLRRATGSEPFDTTADGATADGATALEHPESGEVVWCDHAGVTCRRWNWRQGTRTRLTEQTTAALFIIDVLDPVTDEAAAAATAQLVEQLRLLGSDVMIATRTIRQHQTA